MGQSTKVCWQCRSEVHLLAKVCPACRVKLGDVKSNGLASRPLGCAVWLLMTLGFIFALGFISMQCSTQRHVELKQEAIDEKQAETDRLKAIPAAEHLVWARSEIAGLQKQWSIDRFDKFISRTAQVNRSAAEWTEVQQLIKKGWTLQKTENARLEKERIAAEKKLAKEQEPLRKAYAKELESQLLEKRMNADVTTGGPEHTVITIKWALVSKVTAHDISKNTKLHENLNSLHFKKLIITDGYRESWSWKY